jgi:hypothetical protein
MGRAKVSQPFTFRIWIWPDAIGTQRSIGTVSAQGNRLGLDAAADPLVQALDGV